MFDNTQRIRLNVGFTPGWKDNLLSVIKQVFPLSIKRIIEFEFLSYNLIGGCHYGNDGYDSIKRIKYGDLVKAPCCIQSFIDEEEFSSITCRQITLSSKVYVGGRLYHWLMLDLNMSHQRGKFFDHRYLISGHYTELPDPYVVKTENSYHCYYPLLLDEGSWKQAIADHMFAAQFYDGGKECFDLPWLIATNKRGYGALRIHEDKWLPIERKYLHYLPAESLD